ncbi:cytochrome c [Histidinibacterium aquaticum]|nr:cytochrome c [Histidinibacterium aquaticum]
MKALRLSVALAAIAGAVAWWATETPAVPESYAVLDGDPEAGRVTFAVAGCASCHVAPEAEREEGEPPVLAGGQRFETEFGTFVSPNISSSPQGVGEWSDAELIHAVRAGVSPEGAHYYPAFPYASYAKASAQDIANLVAYMRTLPGSDAESAPHELDFPYSMRRAVGAWKRLYASPDYVLETADTAELMRGRELVEGLGHCGECHTPRTALGGLDTERWLGGAENPSGDGRIPNITPGGLDWSEADIAAYLQSGFTPEFDSAGGEMAEVVRNTAQLSDADRAAMAAYLKAVPAVSDEGA